MPKDPFGNPREPDRLPPKSPVDVRAVLPPPGEATVHRSTPDAAPSTLTVVSDGGSGPAASTTLTPDRTWTVGRSPDADVVVPDSMVSRRHLLLENADSQWVIRDVSANGSWHEGHRIAADGVPVPPGRQVRVALGGRAGPELVISCPGVDPAAAAPTVPVAGPTDAAPRTPKRRRRLRRTAIVLVVVLALLAVADRVAAHVASTQAVSQIVQQSQGLAKRPTVSFGGFPFLTQIAFGRYSDIHVGISAITPPGSPRVEHVDAHLRGAHVPLSTVLHNKVSKIPIDHVTAAVTLRFADLNAFLADQPGKLKLTGHDGAVDVSGQVTEGGQTITVKGSAKLGTEDGGLVITPTSLHVTGGGVLGDISDVLGDAVSAFPPVPVPMPDLPFHLRVTSVHSDDSGLVASAAADGLVLDTGQG